MELRRDNKMADLRDIKDYCSEHIVCEDCPLFRECYRMFGLKSPNAWQDYDIEKMDKEIINDRD